MFSPQLLLKQLTGDFGPCAQFFCKELGHPTYAANGEQKLCSFLLQRQHNSVNGPHASGVFIILEYLCNVHFTDLN